jgi:hypothetical protein
VLFLGIPHRPIAAIDVNFMVALPLFPTGIAGLAVGHRRDVAPDAMTPATPLQTAKLAQHAILNK